jgi:hypothetical protein
MLEKKKFLGFRQFFLTKVGNFSAIFSCRWQSGSKRRFVWIVPKGAG